MLPLLGDGLKKVSLESVMNQFVSSHVARRLKGLGSHVILSFACRMLRGSHSVP